MTYLCRSIDFLDRAEQIHSDADPARLLYAALELRLGIEARLAEYAAHVIGISKNKAKEWEIKKLGKTLHEAYGLGEKMLVIIMCLPDESEAQFLYAPVSPRLQEIGKRLGVFLHAQRLAAAFGVSDQEELHNLLHEGCGLLRLACAGEVLRPSIGDGILVALDRDDPRSKLIESYQNGIEAEFHVFDITPAGPVTYYPAPSPTQL